MRFPLALSLTFLSWLHLSGTSPGQEAAKDSPYYPLKVGTQWTYQAGTRTFTVRVVKHELVGKVMCARLEAGEGEDVKVEHAAAQADGVYHYQAQGKDIQPPLCFLKLPPKKGDTWKVDATVDGLPVKGSFTTDEGDVAVPAGKYKAVIVTTEDFEIGTLKMSLTCWYVSGVGLVKQRTRVAELDIVMELKKPPA